jgi:DNA-binding CsgD family transcriptional regulator
VTTWVKTSLRTQSRVINGLQAFAGRARRELRASGEAVPKHTIAELTPRQAQITRLAWDGRASPEISSRLLIGLRTAGWHLRNVQSAKPAGLRSFGHAYAGRPE